MTRIRAMGSGTFSSLRNRNFRLFFFGQALSQNGTWMQLVAIDLLVLEITDDGVAVGIATAARLAPILVLGSWGGLLSDRRDRHHLLLGLAVVGGMLAAVFGLAVAAGTTSLTVIYLLAGASGVVTALENPARRSFVTDLVGTDEVTNAIGLNSAMVVGSKVIGPAIAGVLITTASISWCFAVNALSFVPQVVLFARLDRSRFRAFAPVAKAKRQIRDGLSYVWGATELRVPLLLVAATGAMTFNYPVILPLLATRDLSGGPVTYTVLLSVMSVGSVIGALTVARTVNISYVFLANAAVALGLASAALAVAPTVELASVAIVPVGVATMLVNSGASSIVQLTARPEMRGRVMAAMSVAFVGSAPLGAPLLGWIAEHAGARIALGAGAVTAVVAGLLAQPHLQRLTTPAVDHPGEAETV